jgi:hypothetical protein
LLTAAQLFDEFWDNGARLLPEMRRAARFWTVAEAALVIGKTQAAVRKMVRENPGVCTTVGGRIVIDQIAFKEWLRKRSDPDAAEST